MTRLTKKFRSKRFRDSYVDANVRMFLAQQIRALRGDMSQEQFAELLGTTQSVVSRFEDPSYGKFNLQTLLEIAAKLNRAVFARIVDFPTFLRLTEDLSEQAICPEGYDADLVERPSPQEPRSEVPARSSVLRDKPEPPAFNYVRENTLLGQPQEIHLKSAAVAKPVAEDADSEKDSGDLVWPSDVAIRRDLFGRGSHPLGTSRH